VLLSSYVAAVLKYRAVERPSRCAVVSPCSRVAVRLSCGAAVLPCCGAAPAVLVKAPIAPFPVRHAMLAGTHGGQLDRRADVRMPGRRVAPTLTAAAWTDGSQLYGRTVAQTRGCRSAPLQGQTVGSCTAVRMYGYSGAPPHSCTAARTPSAQAYSRVVAGKHGGQLHGRAAARVHGSRGAQMQRCTDTLMPGCRVARWTAVRTHGCADALMQCRPGAIMYGCKDAKWTAGQTYRCTDPRHPRVVAWTHGRRLCCRAWSWGGKLRWTVAWDGCRG
jgi:hypothetical protein